MNSEELLPHDVQGTWGLFRDRLVAYMRNRVPEEHAEDLTQEVLLKMHKALPDLRSNEHVYAWMYGIARNTVIDYFRRKTTTSRQTKLLEEEVVDEQVSEQAPHPLYRCLHPLLEELPEKYRETIRRVEFEGSSIRDEAERSQQSLSAVKSRLMRGRAMLRKKLQCCCAIEFDARGKVTAAAIRDKNVKPCGC